MAGAEPALPQVERVSNQRSRAHWPRDVREAMQARELAPATRTADSTSQETSSPAAVPALPPLAAPAATAVLAVPAATVAWGGRAQKRRERTWPDGSLASSSSTTTTTTATVAADACIMDLDMEPLPILAAQNSPERLSGYNAGSPSNHDAWASLARCTN